MPPLRILYVEDNEYLRENIGLLLEGDDREVTLCATGEEALDACASHDFDLVVTDVSLPGISGIDLTRSLLQSAPHRWVVLCTGYPLGQRASELGVNVRSLSKPFELEELDALVAEVVAQRGA